MWLCAQLEEWLADKKQAADDESYMTGKDLRTKFNKHKAFESELTSNRERLNKLKAELNALRDTKPDVAAAVQNEVDRLERQWDELEDQLKKKGQSLFDANRPELLEQNMDEADNWIQQLQTQMVSTAPVTAAAPSAPSLVDVDLELKKHEVSCSIVLLVTRQYTRSVLDG